MDWLSDDLSCEYLFIHRVGLALLKEAKSELLGRSFDATIERLRFLCQRSQLSPEALVASAMEFKVTNRFLSDLEQAITSPSPGSSARLPCCFLERDLDRGRTQCRFLMSKDGSEAPLVTGDNNPTFWEASLPAPRVPSDPLAPGAPAELEKGEKGEKGEKVKAKSQLKSFAKKSQQVLSKVKAPAVLSIRSSGRNAKGETLTSAPNESILHLSDSERVKENLHPSRSSSVPSRGYQRCGLLACKGKRLENSDHSIHAKEVPMMSTVDLGCCTDAPMFLLLIGDTSVHQQFEERD
eukprot:symbB.v1.2.017749.t2/scaffold1390.1/size121990/6